MTTATGSVYSVKHTTHTIYKINKYCKLVPPSICVLDYITCRSLYNYTDNVVLYYCILFYVLIIVDLSSAFDYSRHVSCEPCRGRVNGGYDPNANQVDFRSYTIFECISIRLNLTHCVTVDCVQVVICQNNSTSLHRCCGVLGHEMLHMFDFLVVRRLTSKT